jgi:WD40 repeat protein
MGDIERKTHRAISIPKGISCFDISKRPNFIVTGGADKNIRLWNPYVLSKPAGCLSGHNTSIISIVINHEDGHVISLSEDKNIRVWSLRSLNCIQSLYDNVTHRPENIISALFYDSINRKIMTCSSTIQQWPVKRFNAAYSN